MPRLTLLVLLTLLGGCGPNPSPSSNGAEEAPRPQAASGEPQRSAGVAPQTGRGGEEGVIVTFGDSLTSGYGVPPGDSYPAILQAELNRRGYSYRVVNEGVSGDTTDRGLARVKAILSRKPDYVVVCFGGNDGLRALPIERMKSNLRELVTQLQHGGAEVILAGMKLPPNYGSEYTSAFEKAFRDLAEELKVPFVPFLLEGVGGDPDFMQGDGIHPKVEGNRRVARNVLEVLEPLLAARSVRKQVR